MHGDEAFKAFTRRWEPDFRKLARMTQGEKDVGDLVSEAWLLSFDVQERRGIPFDFEDLQDQHLLMRWLNFEITRKGDFAFRFANRPDGCDDELSLWDVLAADDSSDPLERLIANQDVALSDELSAASYSEFTAYWISWQNLGQTLADLANHLAISSGALVNRFRRRQLVMKRQASLFDTVEQIPSDFVPMRRLAYVRTTRDEATVEQANLEL